MAGREVGELQAAGTSKKCLSYFRIFSVVLSVFCFARGTTWRMRGAPNTLLLCLLTSRLPLVRWPLAD